MAPTRVKCTRRRGARSGAPRTIRDSQPARPIPCRSGRATRTGCRRTHCQRRHSMAASPPVNGRAPGTVPTAPLKRGRLETPVHPSQRILTVDILRGFALLGILLVNMALFNQSVLSLALKLNPPATPVDQVADWLI